MLSSNDLPAITVVVLLLAGLPASAQDLISVASGLINFTQGPVQLNDRVIQPAKGQPPQLRVKDTLRTSESRAEVLLSPGVFLRVGDNSAIQMVSSDATDSRLELLSGAAVVEVVMLRLDATVTIAHGDSTVSILKRGLYRLDTNPAQLKVLDGKALMESGSQRVGVGKGKMVFVGGKLATTKFDRKKRDSLDLWSERRAENLAVANIATARLLRGGTRASTNGWGWSPPYGMYTFIPMVSGLYSPYGSYFWSPRDVNPSSTPSGPTGPSGVSSGGRSLSGTIATTPGVEGILLP